MDGTLRSLRSQVFSGHWPLDQQITAIAEKSPSHDFLSNPASQYVYVYLTRYVRTLSEHMLKRPFNAISVLDWGCGKGHVSKLIRDLGPKSLESCDLVSSQEDSAFGQDTPIIKEFKISVTPLDHDYELPYLDKSFDVVLSVGVLEHVVNDRASLTEIKRVLKPGGIFFCFNLPATLSWTQKLSHLRGNFYHDRLYNERVIKEMLLSAGLDLLDLWYRQILPKNSVRYPNFRMFERLDQFVTFYSPFRVFATSIEFIASNK
jgi:SAM-dependent methyltransferase